MNSTEAGRHGGLLERTVGPTHWMDDRGQVVTDKWRRSDKATSDCRAVYAVPCRYYFGRLTPLHKCGHCGGKGKEPAATYDPCSVCGRSGGLPNAEAQPQTGHEVKNGK